MDLKQLKKLKLFKDEKLINLDILENQGFCNINYKLTTSKGLYLIREFKSDMSVNISREFEYKTQNKAYKKNIAPKAIYMDKDKSFMITEFLKGSHKEKLSQKDISRLVKAIKKIHSIKVTQKPYNLKKDFIAYSRSLNDNESKRLIKSSLKELKGIRSFKSRYVTTHHDLNPKNIIFHKSTIKFIDWEYVGVNDCFFDLASICVEFNLDKKEQNYLLNKYFTKVKAEYKSLLKAYIYIYEALCILWFKVQN